MEDAQTDKTASGIAPEFFFFFEGLNGRAVKRAVDGRKGRCSTTNRRKDWLRNRQETKDVCGERKDAAVSTTAKQTSRAQSYETDPL